MLGLYLDLLSHYFFGLFLLFNVWLSVLFLPYVGSFKYFYNSILIYLFLKFVTLHYFFNGCSIIYILNFSTISTQLIFYCFAWNKLLNNIGPFTSILYVSVVIYSIILFKPIKQCYNFFFALNSPMCFKARKRMYYSYIYPDNYHFLYSSFLPEDSSFHLVSFPFAWRTPSSTSCRTGLLAIYNFCFVFFYL